MSILSIGMRPHTPSYPSKHNNVSILFNLICILTFLVTEIIILKAVIGLLFLHEH